MKLGAFYAIGKDGKFVEEFGAGPAWDPKELQVAMNDLENPRFAQAMVDMLEHSTLIEISSFEDVCISILRGNAPEDLVQQWKVDLTDLDPALKELKVHSDRGGSGLGGWGHPMFEPHDMTCLTIGTENLTMTMPKNDEVCLVAFLGWLSVVELFGTQEIILKDFSVIVAHGRLGSRKVCVARTGLTKRWGSDLAVANQAANNKKWRQWLKEFKEHMKTYGTNPARNDKTSSDHLSAWVRNQRFYARNFERGAEETSGMTAEWVQLLKAAGLDIDPRETLFQLRLKEFKEHMKTYGTTPARNDETCSDQLSNWVKNHRFYVRNFERGAGETRGMTAERVQLLKVAGILSVTDSNSHDDDDAPSFADSNDGSDGSDGSDGDDEGDDDDNDDTAVENTQLPRRSSRGAAAKKTSAGAAAKKTSAGAAAEKTNLIHC
jgi:hypothetical protein